MSASERIAYLKGLAEGLGVDGTSKEGRLLAAVIQVLEDLARDLGEVQKSVSAMDEAYSAIEDLFDTDFPYFDEDDEDEDEDEDEDDLLYEFKCPLCGGVITVDEDVIFSGRLSCPHCGETVDLELSVDDFEEE